MESLYGLRFVKDAVERQRQMGITMIIQNHLTSNGYAGRVTCKKMGAWKRFMPSTAIVHQKFVSTVAGLQNPCGGGDAIHAMNTSGGTELRGPMPKTEDRKKPWHGIRNHVYVADGAPILWESLCVAIARVAITCSGGKTYFPWTTSNRCHLALDHALHQRHAAETRRRTREAAGQLSFLE
jgi:hypothetical protein